MKLTSAAVAVAGFVASANAHATFQKFWPTSSTGTASCVRIPTNNSPLGTTDANLACNNGGSTAASSVCSVGAGTQVAFEMHQQPNTSSCSDEAIGGNHDGPTIIYMKKVSSPSDSGSGGGWFKVAQTGLVSASGSTYVWGTDTMNSNCGKVYFTIPACIPAGNYLVRAEVIALHVAGSAGGAQHYASCAQVSVTGGGSTSPSSTVSFPGAYSQNDPGILFNIYGSYTSYPVPGPAVFSCNGQPGTTGVPNTSTTAVVTSTPTTTAGGPAQTAWGQCGGIGWTGPTSCVSGYKCTKNNDYYYQCTPA